MTLRCPQRYDHTNAQQHGSNNKNFNKVITKCYNKNACGSKITVRADDRKQEVYNWWPYIYIIIQGIYTVYAGSSRLYKFTKCSDIDTRGKNYP